MKKALLFIQEDWGNYGNDSWIEMASVDDAKIELKKKVAQFANEVDLEDFIIVDDTSTSFFAKCGNDFYKIFIKEFIV